MPVGSFPLKGKIAVVTGGGSGINLSFVKLCVEKGGRAIIADLKLTQEAEEYAKEAGSKVVVFEKCDVTKRQDLENLAAVSKAKFDDVPDVWIAGAGVFEPSWSNFWDDEESDGYKQVDINVTHPIKLSRIAVRSLLKANKKGVILVVASLAGYQGAYAAPLYCATKHACVGLVRSLAELDRLEDIKVVLTAPGLVRTPLWTDYPEKMKQFGYTMENTITADAVAMSMIDLVQGAEYPGGSCMEVASSGTRLLGTWDIPAPPAVGTSVPKDILELNYKPVRDICDTERGTS